MKRKLLLTCIPALMLLGSCAGAQPEVKQAEFIEDTLLHEEIFGDVSSAFGKVKRNALPEDVDVSAPAIGVQMADNGSTYSVRFIAATNIAEGSLVAGKAVWTRAMYKADGTKYKEATAKPSSVAYTTLKDGSGTPYTIGQFNTKYGTDYDSFVVYTMLNIPKTTYDNYYLKAYLTTDVGSASSKTSKVLATNVIGSKRVTFASTYTGYFLKGTILGNSNIYLVSDDGSKGENLAAFFSEFKANDEFLIVYNNTDDDEFLIYDSSALVADGTTSIYFENKGGKIKAKYSAGCSLYFNKSKKLECANVWAPEKSVWTNRNDVWQKTASLIDNPDKSGEYMAINVGLESGEEFLIRATGDAYRKSVSAGDDKGNFESSEGGNIQVKAGKGGNYTFYIWGDTSKQDGLSAFEQDTLDVTFNVTLPAGSDTPEYLGVKYRTGTSGDDSFFGGATLVDGIWTVHSNNRIMLSPSDNDFEFFIEMYKEPWSESPKGNANIVSATSPSFTRLTATIVDKGEQVIINIAPASAITSASNYNAGTKTGTNCSVE